MQADMPNSHAGIPIALKRAQGVVQSLVCWEGVGKIRRPRLIDNGSCWNAGVWATFQAAFWQCSGEHWAACRGEGKNASRRVQAPEAGFTPMEKVVAVVVLQIGVSARMRNFGVVVCQDQGQGKLAVQTTTHCQNTFHSSGR